MNGFEQVGLIILGGAMAGGGGLAVSLLEHRHQRREARRLRQEDALLQLADALLPILLELERWVGDRKGTIWVGRSRSLSGLGTWILDDESNAHQPLDWDAITRLTQQAERLWWGDLRTRVYDPPVTAAWGDISGTAFELSLGSISDPRTVAMNLKSRVTELDEIIRGVLADGRRGKPNDHDLTT
jgi:hypothetical protein